MTITSSMPQEVIDHIIDEFYSSCQGSSRHTLAALRVAGWATYHKAHALLFRLVTLTADNINHFLEPCPTFRHPSAHIPVLIREVKIFELKSLHRITFSDAS